MSEAFPDVLRRRFLAVATRDYTDGVLAPLTGVDAEVEALHRWLCDPALDRRRFRAEHLQLRHNPTIGQIEDALRFPDHEWNDGDAIVLFVTGHGLQHPDGHFIAVEKTVVGKPRRTAIKTDQLVGWLRDTEAEHLMVILDLCHAGASAELTIRLPDFPPSWLLVASAGRDEKAQTGALTGAVTHFLDTLASPAGGQYDNKEPHLNIEEFLRAIQAALPEGQRLHRLGTGVGTHATSPCLPNPHYAPRAELTERPRRPLAIRADDLEAHWEPKTRRFVGRAEAMRHLVRHVASQAEQPRPLVVTGAAGAGKSAVLARLVTLADPTFRRDHPQILDAAPPELVPQPGAVDVAILATGQTPEDILGQLLDVLQVPPLPTNTHPTLEQSREHLSRWLDERPQPVTVVVDALDEAGKPHSVLSDVLLPLTPSARADARGLRWVIGVRSPSSDPDGADANSRSLAQAPTTQAAAFADLVVDALGAERMPVDEHPWWNDDDLADYATTILTTTEGSPYRAAHEQPGRDAGDGDTRAVATAIATRARRSFLVTRLSAANLAKRPAVVDPEDSSWHALVDDGVLGAFRADLHAELPDPEHRLRAIHLLRAVAFAYGRGLPWSQVWPLVANAIADRPGTYGDNDIVALLGSRLAGYLTTDQEDGITVYRLFHDALRGTLRERWQELHQQPETSADADE